MENDAVKFTKGIHKLFADNKFATKAIIIANIVICIGVVALSYRFVKENESQIYVLDQGAVLSAFRSDNGVQKDLEIMNHMYRFHELLFNMPPNMEMIEKNAQAAIELADKSAYDYYMDLKEQQYFTRLISTNSSLQINVDSVKTDVFHYPYKTHTYATIYVIRESNITEFCFESECQVTESVRTVKNPHGLMIEKFWVPKFEMGETRSRK